MVQTTMCLFLKLIIQNIILYPSQLFLKKRWKKMRNKMKKLFVTRQTIISIENDKYNPNLDLVMKMDRFLETTVEKLFELDE